MSTAIESSWKRDQLGALIKKRHSLYHQGDRVHYPTADDTPYCYKVLKGTILLSRDVLDSKSTVLGIVDPGRLFGEEAQFGILRSHDAVAAVETVVQRVLITSEIIETLLKDLMHRSNFLEQLFGAKKCEDRLQLIVGRLGELDLSIATFASIGSMSREMLSRLMKIETERPRIAA